MLKEQLTKLLSGLPGREHSLSKGMEEGRHRESLIVDGMGGEKGSGVQSEATDLWDLILPSGEGTSSPGC